MATTKSKKDWLVGYWQCLEEFVSVLFIINKSPKGFSIEAIDESNGEELAVSKVKWDGKILSFETLTPSNKWRTKNRLEVISENNAIHELTFWEPWKKVQPDAIPPSLLPKKTGRRPKKSPVRANVNQKEF